MRARQLFATALLVIAATPADAQWGDQQRQERFQRYQYLKSTCDSGDTRACIELGHMQEQFASRLRQDCQQGVQQSCVMLGRIEERRREEWQDQQDQPDQGVPAYPNMPLRPVPLQPQGQFQRQNYQAPPNWVDDRSK
jgi:hypothetical protein